MITYSRSRLQWWLSHYQKSIIHLRKSGSSKSRDAGLDFQHAVATIDELITELERINKESPSNGPNQEK